VHFHALDYTIHYSAVDRALEHARPESANRQAPGYIEVARGGAQAAEKHQSCRVDQHAGDAKTPGANSVR